MDLLQKIETLLNATTRAGLPRRRRRSSLDEHEAQLLADVRQALTAVEFQERALAERLKMERVQAQEAAQVGDQAEQRAHEKRAVELERELEQESIQAINLEDKLKALEEKLALAKEAVDKQAKIAAARDEAASKVMGGSDVQAKISTTSSDQATPADFSADVPAVAARKSRLSG